MAHGHAILGWLAGLCLLAHAWEYPVEGLEGFTGRRLLASPIPPCKVNTPNCQECAMMGNPYCVKCKAGYVLIGTTYDMGGVLSKCLSCAADLRCPTGECVPGLGCRKCASGDILMQELLPAGFGHHAIELTNAAVRRCVSPKTLGCATGKDYLGCDTCPKGSARVKEAYFYDAYTIRSDYGMNGGNFTAYAIGFSCVTCSSLGCGAGDCKDDVGCTRCPPGKAPGYSPDPKVPLSVRTCRKPPAVKGCKAVSTSTGACAQCSQGFMLLQAPPTPNQPSVYAGKYGLPLDLATIKCNDCASYGKCASCDPIKGCTSCPANHLLVPDANNTLGSSVCRPCQEVLGCKECDAKGGCKGGCPANTFPSTTSSPQPYVSSLANVKTCLPTASSLCSTTKPFLGCTACKPGGSLGYYSTSSPFGLEYTSSQSARTCLDCKANSGCETCDSNGCLTCPKGAFLDGGYCATCANRYGANCTACNAQGCTSPSPKGYYKVTGYYSNVTELAACPDNCATCVDQKGCIACKAGFLFQGGFDISDVATSGRCMAVANLDCTTTNSTGCTACRDGYFLKQEPYYKGSISTCVACPEGCAGACVAGKGCTKCKAGYYTTSAYSPYQVMYDSSFAGCGTCDAWQSSMVGTNLFPVGYQKNGGCQTCSAEQGCTKCRAGYYRWALGFSTSVCLPCNADRTYSTTTAAHCKERGCKDGTTGCSKCPAGSVFVPVNKYTNCPPGCARCNLLEMGCTSCDAKGCKTCPKGFYKVSGTPAKCAPCPSGCAKCEDGKGCTACAQGFFAYQANPGKVTCASCPLYLGCTDCNPNKGCNSCPPGKKVKSVAGSDLFYPFQVQKLSVCNA